MGCSLGAYVAVSDPSVQTQSGRILLTLVQRAAEGADTTHIAEAVVATWRQIDTALAPIIGPGSVTVLFMRSIHLIEPAHPWLAGMHSGMQTKVDLEALRTTLVQRDSETAAAAAGALLQTFYELLASLVGPSLTERLLHSVWENSLSGPSAQDTLP